MAVAAERVTEETWLACCVSHSYDTLTRREYRKRHRAPWLQVRISSPQLASDSMATIPRMRGTEVAAPSSSPLGGPSAD